MIDQGSKLSEHDLDEIEVALDFLGHMKDMADAKRATAAEWRDQLRERGEVKLAGMMDSVYILRSAESQQLERHISWLKDVLRLNREIGELDQGSFALVDRYMPDGSDRKYAVPFSVMQQGKEAIDDYIQRADKACEE